MKRVLALSILTFCLAASVNAQSPKRAATAQATPPASNASASPAALNAARASFARLPLSFEENAGQTDSRVKYTSRGPGYNLFLTANEAVFALRGGNSPANCAILGQKIPANCTDSARNTGESSVLWLKMLGANALAQVSGTDPLPGKINYYIGNSPSKWRTGVRQYGRVSYSGIYPGIDLTYYGNQQQLESDFIVAPGASPQSIEFEIKGARETRLDPQGNLVLVTNAGNVQLLRPGIYQTIKGVRRDISGSYVLRGQNRIGFAVGSYDRREKLIIDPTLVYSTFLGGGSLFSSDAAQAIAIDSAGHAYVTGQGGSADFPGSDIAGPPVAQLSNFVFITEFDTNGSSGGTILVYSTILSGAKNSFGNPPVGNGIGVDSSGNAYVAGVTSAPDFPMVNPFQATYGQPTQTGFVAGFASATGALTYSTYFGGRNTDDSSELQGLFADSAGNAYVVGDTTSPNFPTVNPLQATLNGSENVVVAKFNPQGQPVYSTYLGGNSFDFGTAIAVDGAGSAYVTGNTSSTNFPLQSSPVPFQNMLTGGQNVFISKLTFSGSTLTLAGSTYLGGGSTDLGMGIAVDTATPPNVYVTGQTTSSGAAPSGFPTTVGAFSTAYSGSTDAFVTKLKGDFTALMYSTYLGGSGRDVGNAIGLDGSGNVYITGGTASSNFPTKMPLQSALGNVTATNVFVTQLNSTGTALGYSTYLGGVGTDMALGIAIDATGNAYIAGETTSPNFPVMSGAAAGTNPFQGQLGSSTGNAFVAKISPVAAPSALNFFPPSYNYHDAGIGASLLENVTLNNNTSATATVSGFAFGGADSTDFTILSAQAPCAITGSFSLPAGTSCVLTVKFTPMDQDVRSATLTVNYNSTSSSVMNLSGNGGAPEVSLSTIKIDFGNDPLNVIAFGGVTVTNTGGGPLQIGSAQIQASTPTNAAQFTLPTSNSSCFTTPIPPRSSCTIEVDFVPTAGVPLPGTAYNATLLLNSNAAGSPATVTLSGTGVQEIIVQPVSLELGIQIVGSTSKENQNEAFLVNGSGETINVAVAPGTGADQGDFHINNSQSGFTACGTVGSLLPGGTCSLFVYFQPTAVSATDGRTGSYTISWTGTAAPSVVPGSQVVSVMGTGITGISLYKTSITGPNEYVGFTESSAGLEYLANGTPNPITVTIALTGNNPGDFAATLDSFCAPGGVIPANTYCRVDLSFTPSAIGLRTATVAFNYTGVSNGQLLLSASGTGIPGPVFIETASDFGFLQQVNTFDFGSEIISTTTPEKRFLIRNAATTPLTVQSITVPGNPDFKIAPDSTCGTANFTIKGGSSCFIGVAFTPSSTGSKESTSIVITDSYSTTNGTDAGSPHTLTLTGTGELAKITVSVTNGGANLLDFGNVALNPSPVPQAAIYLANAGNAPTTITWTGGSPVLAAGSNAAFGLVASGANLTTCTQNKVVLPQGGSCLIGVTFNPTATGLVTASVIFSDSVGGAHTVNIQGNGVGQGKVAVDKTNLTYTQVPTSPNPTPGPTQTVTLTNTGSGPLTITSAVISGFGNNVSTFAIASGTTCALGTVVSNVAPNNTCIFNLTFAAPETAGFYFESLSIQTNLGNNISASDSVFLQGQSVAGGFTLSPAGPIDFGTVAIGSTVTSAFYTLTNENAATVTFGPMSVPSGYTIPFDGCSGKMVTALSGCSFEISFTPTSAISFNGPLSLPYTGPTGSPFTVALKGIGSAAVSANPNPLNFQAFAGSTAFQTVTIGNGSSSSATITGVSGFTGANAADFSISFDACFSGGTGAVLSASGGTCSIDFTFLSPTAGNFTAQFTVSYSIGSVPQTPVTVTLNATIPAALVTVIPNPVVFAGQTVNTQSQTMNVTLTNSPSATQALTVSTMQIAGNDFAVFSPGGGNCFFVAAGKSCTVQVAFTPTAAGARTGTLTITDNSTTSPHVVNLQGTGIAGSVSASPSNLAFPLTTDGTSVTMGAVLSNTMGSTITVNSVVFTGPYATDIGSGTCVNGNKISAVTGTCVVYIKFTPTGVTNAGTATVNYTINSGSGPTPGSVVITLSGTGTNPSINVNPTSLIFSSQTVGSSSAAQPVTLSNPTSTAASVSGTPSITGTNASDFTLGTNTCTSGASLPAATGSCVVNVIFKPGAAGGTSRAATLSISDSPDSGSPHTVSLSGTAIQPVAGLSGTTLAFGNLDTGATSGQQTVTLTNTGNASMTISSVILGGTNAGDFAQVTPASGTDCRTVGTLAAGASCNVAATFTPTATGSRSATITITDNANPATQVISLTGNGTQPVVGLLPTTIAFGNQLLSTTSTKSTSTLTNSGTGPLTITAVTLGGTNQGDFALVTPANGADCRTVGTVAAAGTCVIAATFTPSALGGRSATISVTDNASGSPHSLVLTGTGVFPQATPTPSPVTFGNQILNVASAAQTLTLTNGGTATLNLTTVALGGTNANQFAIATGTTCTNGSMIAAGATCLVKLTFTPTTLGSQTATVTFTDNASPATQVASLTGTGVFPAATPSPSPVAFGNQRQNTTSAAQTLTLTNGGTGSLNLTTVALGGTNANQFSIVTTGTTCTNGSTVLAGATCVVKLTFTPTALGSQTATVTFTDNANPTTQVVNLSGTGTFPQATATPAPVAFGSQTNTITSGPHTVTLTNGGTGTLNLTTVALGGTNPSVFAIVPGTTTCTNGSTVGAGASCVVNVTFTPSGLTSFSATLTFTDDATPTTQVVNLTGTGVTSTINFSPSTLAFGNQLLSTASGPITTTMTNSGATSLSISAIAITGTNLSDFTLVAPASGTPCPASGQVAAGASCTIAATFTPSALGGRSATVSVTDNASGSPHSLPLTGTGVFPQATPTPSPVVFGNQMLNVASAAQTLTLTNGGTATLNLTTVALGGTNASQFAIATGTTCTNTSTIAAGANCVVKLSFTPTALGSQAATVTFTDDASPATQVVNIIGNGVFPQATPSPSPVAFGNQRQSTTSAAQTLTLTNGGTGILNLTTVALGGTNANQFTIVTTGTTCTNGSTVAAGGTCVVKLAFTPTALGSQTATVTFTDNANPTTQVVNLTGTGTFPQASPAPATLAFGSQTNTITSGPRTITLTNGGTGTLNLTTVALGGTNPSVFAIASGTTCTNGSTIAGGGSCVVNVTFTPSGLTSFSATLTFTDDATPTSQVVNLTGTGVTSTVNFSPSTVAFANQRQGTPSLQMSSTLTYTGSGTLLISGATITGSNPGDFALATLGSGTDCRTAAPLSAGGTCVIAATFTPTATGARSATVSVADNASGSPHTFALTGTGTASAVTLSTSNVTFVNQIQTTTSSAQTITVTNTGTATLNIGTVVLGGTNPSDFAIVSGTGTTCIPGAAVGFTAPNNTCTVAVTFTPATANPFSATLTFTDDATPTTQVVNMSGTGLTPPTATPAPTSLTFPGQPTTTTSTAQNITLTNNGGAPLSITSIAFAGTNPGDFKFASPATSCPTSSSGQVAAGASCVLSVTFTPTASGARTANIAITVTGIANPAPIALSGTGTAPDLAISKSHLGSFEVGVNNTYAIKLTNNGTAATQAQITVTDTLPAGLGFVSGGPAGWTCNAGAQNAQIVTCTNAGPIAVGASSTLTLTVSVASAAFPSVTNMATAADAGDLGTNDKTATDAPTAVTAPDVTITKTHPSGDFVVGSTGTYTIKVTNNGSGPTTGNITLTDTLPTGLSFVSNTGAGWACAVNAQNAQSVLCTHTGAPLAAAGGSSSFTLTVSVAPGAFPSVTNTATVADPNDGRSTDKSATDSPTNIDNVVPTQSAFSPNLGLIAGATSAQQITITGTGLNGSTQVTLGSTAPLNTPLTGTANAAGTSLVISVPTAELVAANAGNLTITVTNPKNPTSNAGGGVAATTQTLPLVGLSSLTPPTGTPNPIPVVAGTPFALTMNLNLTPSGATLPADVTITCSLPTTLTGATCTANPSTIMHGTAASAATTVVTINAVPTKKAGGALSPSLPQFGGRGPWSTYPLWLLATVLLSMLGMLGAVRQRAAQFRRVPMYLTLAVLVLAAGALVGCTTASGPTPTPTGPSTVTVTATTADGATVSATVNIIISN